MQLQRPWPLIMALLLAIGLPIAAFAGGWSVVTLDSLPGDLAAGSDATIGFTVLQHGRTPLVDQRPKVVFTNTTTGESTLAIAYPEGKPGHYTAKFALSQPGTWSWAIDVFEGPHPMPALSVVMATAPAPRSNEAPAPVPNAPFGQASSADWLPAAGGTALVIALGLVFAYGLRRRGQSGQVAP